MKKPRPPRSSPRDARQLLFDIVDHLAPRLDTYELAIYLYLLRHTRLAGKLEIKLSLGTARLGMAGGRPRKGMSRKTCLERIRSLDGKGLIRARTSRRGTRIRLFLPMEVRGVVVREKSFKQPAAPRSADFYRDPENRRAIVKREGTRCFYCGRALGAEITVMDHAFRPSDNSYRNMVAACRPCNSRKHSEPADAFLRRLYQEGFLPAADFRRRMARLQKLRRGLLKPAA